VNGSTNLPDLKVYLYPLLPEVWCSAIGVGGLGGLLALGLELMVSI